MLRRSLLLTLTGGALAALVPVAEIAAAAPARVLVYASEYRLNVSRALVPAGPVVIELRNIGEDAHDLVLRSIATGRELARTPVVRHGRGATLRLVLAPGRYHLSCDVSGHAGHGMTATLVARKRLT